MFSERFEQALVLAHQLHKTQTRKASNTPYIAHLLAVAALVTEHGASEDEAIAALLHDAAEDQGGASTLQLIEDRFGARVAEWVEACSDTIESPKPPWKARKQAFVERIHTASPEVLRIVAADKLHNARSIIRDRRAIGERAWDRFTATAEDSRWYYVAVAKALKARGAHAALITELEFAVLQLTDKSQ